MKKRSDNVQEELESLSPFLAKLRKEDPGFKVPEGFFQHLTGEIMEQVRLMPAPMVDSGKGGAKAWRPPFIAVWRMLRQPGYALALASVIVLVMAGLFWLRPQPGNYAGSVAWSDISTQEMTEYVEENIQEFELELLVELAPGLEQRSILSGTGIETDMLDEYLEDILNEVEIEELENLF